MIVSEDNKGNGEHVYLSCFFKNLNSQFACGSQNNCQRIGAARSTPTLRLGLTFPVVVIQNVGDDGQEECSSFATAGLSGSHQIASTHDNWQSMFLHWGRLVVTYLK